MITNDHIAEVFLRIGDLMDYREENTFKVRSYWRAAEMLLSLPEPVAEVMARGELERLPGVGEAIAGKIGEILETGTCSLYERLKGEVAPDVHTLLRDPGLTPRLVRLLVRERGLASPADLIDIVREGLTDIPNLSGNDAAQVLRAAFSVTHDDAR